MKKKLLICAAMLCGFTAYAQSDFGEEEAGVGVPKAKKFAFFIGPKVGVTFTTMTDPKQGALYDSFGIGYSGGVAVQGRFGNSSPQSPGGTGIFGAGLELKYKLNSVKTLGVDEKGKESAKLNLSYFEVPLYVHIYPAYKSKALNGLYLEAGVSVAGTMSAKPESIIANEVYYKTGDLKGFDVRPLVGLGFTTSCGFDVNARYYIGTSDLAKNMASKQNSFELSLSWMFKL